MGSTSNVRISTHIYYTVLAVVVCLCVCARANACVVALCLRELSPHPSLLCARVFVSLFPSVPAPPKKLNISVA